MDAKEEESLSKPSQEEEQDSVTAFDASQEHPITAQQCGTGLQNLPEGGEMAAQPLVSCSEDEKDVLAEELSTNTENRDEAQAVKEKDDSVEEIAEIKGVVVGDDMSEARKDTVANDEVGVAVKNKEEEITDLADESCDMEVIEAENKDVVDVENVAPEVKLEDSVLLKTEATEKENYIGMPDTIEEKDVSMVNEFGIEDASKKVNDGAAKRKVADETNVAGMALETKKVSDETDMAVETKKAEEGEDDVIMPDKAVELEEKVAGTEMADMTDVLVARSEATEADGVGMEDNSRKVDNKVELADKVNVSGMVDATAEGEGADGDGAEEEALEAEETEAANESDFAAAEADVADRTEDIEGAEEPEAEEMEVEEDQSRSVSGGKRKRGKNSKSTGKVPARKKLEEDVCFICFDGGDLVLCDRRGCPKAYHPSCVNHDEAFFRTKGKWNCGWHLCSYCAKNAYFMCYTCTFSLCKGCTKNAVIYCVRRNKGFCEACMRIVMLIEQSEQGNKDTGPVDFDDKNSWEYLFKDYYIDLKGKLSLTHDELAEAKNPWKGADALPAKAESPDELYDANNDRSSHSDSCSEDVEMSSSKRRKAKKQLKSRSRKGDLRGKTTMVGAKGLSSDDSSEWASKELLEFVMHMKNHDKSVLSQFDVQALLLEYIKRNKLRDPRRKSQIICDARLQNLFGKPRVGHFEMLKLLESHFLLKEDSQAEDLQGSVVDTEVHLEGDGISDSYHKAGKDKRRKTHKKGDSRGLQSNLNDYAAIDNHNINLIYLRRNLVEDLLEDTEKFHDKVVGSFVRIRISGSSQKQDLYRLVQVVGTGKAVEPYKVGKRMTDTLLEILNLNKTEIVSIDNISNQEFSEDECKRLRQSIKCGLINRLTVGDIQEKALMLQMVRVKDWLETEIERLSHLRDRASEKGHRKELRECVEKLQLLKTPEERQRRLDEIPEIHADPNMDPSHESEEEMDDKRQENYTRPRGTAFGWKGGETASPRRGGSSLNDSWSGTRTYPNVSRELSRNLSNKGFSTKGDDMPAANVIPNDVQLLHRRDRELHPSSSWERPKLSSSFQNGAEDTQRVGSSSPFSTALSEEASPAPSSTRIAPPVVINEAEKMWHYQDPSGKVQGPFSIVQLRKWNNTGYFPADLRIWRTTEKQDESILLTDALSGKFSKELLVDKAFPKDQMVQDLHSSSSYSGKPHLPAQGIGPVGGAQGISPVGGRLTFDQNSGINSVMSRHAPLTVDIPSNPAYGLGSDAVIRNESTNLPSPTPQTTPGGTEGLAFENKWSPTPLQSAGTLLGNSFPGIHGGLQAPGVMIAENMVQIAENGLNSHGITSALKSENGMFLSSTDTSHVDPQAAEPGPVLAEALTNTGVDFNTAGTAMQNPGVSGHNLHAETQAWGSGIVPKSEMAGSSQLQGGEPQAWGVAPSMRVEPNNSSTLAAQPPPHGHWVDASSVQSSIPFSGGNPIGNFPMPGFPGMITSEPWRPPPSNNQSSIQPPGPPNMTWGTGVSENQNVGWGMMPGNQNMNWVGALPANMNTSWMTGQGPAPGNTNPGWVAPSQGPSINAANWVAPGQGPSNMNANANPSWAMPGQTPAGVNANPGWAASTGNQGMTGGEQSRYRDRFPNQGDHVAHGSDTGYGGGKRWNRQSSFRSGGSSSRPPSGGQRGVCNFYKNGHCKKGSKCDYLHI